LFLAAAVLSAAAAMYHEHDIYVQLVRAATVADMVRISGTPRALSPGSF